MVENLPAKQESQVRSLGWEDPLEKGMATHSSILAWSIPQTEEPGGQQSTGSQKVGHDWATNTFTGGEILDFERDAIIGWDKWVSWGGNKHILPVRGK